MRTHLPAVARPRLTRLCVLAAIAACAATAWLAAAPPRAEAADCGVRRLCLYSGVDWTGRVVTISERDLRKRKIIKVDPLVKGRVSSWINTTSLKLCGETDKPVETFIGKPFARDPYVGDLFNNETDQVSRC
jgi:Peptidase inhibitor family I36